MKTGIVLSGGGARGAYEAGVIAGLMEVLHPTAAPFDIVCGTSVGAINAAYLAAHADQPDMGAAGLISEWQGLDLSKYLQLDMRGVLGFKRGFSLQLPSGISKASLPHHIGRSLLHAGALEGLVNNRIPWPRLHDNIAAGRLSALVIAALHIASGKTALFGELAPGVAFKPSKDPRRTPHCGPIGPEHVLASAAIPLLFPARRVGNDYFCDGGVRFNTPIAPAIRAGAERLVVISLLSEDDPAEHPMTPAEASRIDAYQSPLYLIGKVLNALLLDPLHYDLQVLARFNHLIETLEDVLDPEELARVQDVVRHHRGLPYRSLKTLVFRPSRDIGHMARMRAERIQASRFSSWFLARTATLGALWESDLVSFLLFDAEFASELVRLGRDDTVCRAEEIRAFFSAEPMPASIHTRGRGPARTPGA